MASVRLGLVTEVTRALLEPSLKGGSLAFRCGRLW
eukprot:CAMPEP_0175158562 /NCGR_PEP_ID=MMETSP0087-20121206/22885_1 /TAXON_ID=136419 /ORGANISM="Unknown Unknown, Strain D1" /LENGTH=34 /DNA_ID= /DNA_START= /DNA_END= /DNA_ORIENTATION=